MPLGLASVGYGVFFCFVVGGHHVFPFATGYALESGAVTYQLALKMRRIQKMAYLTMQCFARKHAMSHSHVEYYSATSVGRNSQDDHKRICVAQNRLGHAKETHICFCLYRWEMV